MSHRITGLGEMRIYDKESGDLILQGQLDRFTFRDEHGQGWIVKRNHPKDFAFDAQTVKKIFDAFPNGFINHNLEFIADPHRRVNSYFRLEDCKTEEDVAAKMLEWLSREAYKSQHFDSERRNREVHAYHLKGINAFCGTAFTEDDIEEIYTYLGNEVNHQKTLKFIRSGYDLAVLTEKED